MNLRAIILFSTLPLAACAAKAESDDDGAHAATSSAVMSNGRGVPCHFTVAGCPGEGPDGFAQDPNNPGAAGGGGGYATPPSDPGGAQAFVRCSHQCTSASAGVSQSLGACELACSTPGARFVHHIPGVGFVGDGTPPDPSNYGTCINGCAAEETQCIDACASGGVF